MPKNGLKFPEAMYYQAKFIRTNISDNSPINIDTSANQRSISQVNLVWFNGGTVKMIPKQIFEVFPNLSYVDIELTELEEIKPENFVRASLLKVLVLSRNKLTKLDPHLFIHAINLQFINFQFNQITDIDPDTFADIIDLQGLSFENNRITKLDEKSFLNIPTIQMIYLQSNQIKDLHYGTFSRLTNLKELDLSQNSCIDKTFSKISGNFKFMDLEIYTVCHDNLKMKDITEMKNFSKQANSKFDEILNLNSEKLRQTQTSTMEFNDFKIQPLNASLLAFRKELMDLQSVHNNLINNEIQINKSLNAWKADNDADFKFKSLAILMEESKLNITRSAETFKNRLIDSKNSKLSKISDLKAAFEKLKKDYKVIQYKSNANIKSLRACVIFLFVGILAISAGFFVFAWKKVNPANYYPENDHVDTL